jgi:hypothetical protein
VSWLGREIEEFGLEGHMKYQNRVRTFSFQLVCKLLNSRKMKSLITIVLILVVCFPLAAHGGLFSDCKALLIELNLLSPPPPKNPSGHGYANRYLDKDVANGVLVYSHGKWGYLDNPTRFEMDRAIRTTKHGERFFDMRFLGLDGAFDPDEVQAMFVINTKGQLRLGRDRMRSITTDWGESRGIYKMPHSTIISDEKRIERVLAAGQMFFKDGKIFRVDNLSGHFPSGPEVEEVIRKILDKYRDLLHPEFKGIELFGRGLK